jgi:hypothetical protein
MAMRHSGDMRTPTAMRPLSFVFLAFAAFFLFPLPAQNRRIVLPPGDDAYALVSALSFESGKLPLSADAPQDLGRLFNTVAQADNALGGRSLAAVVASLAYLSRLSDLESPGVFTPSIAGIPPVAVSLKAAANPEIYLSRGASGLPAFYGYEDRDSLLSIPVSLSIADAFAMGAGFDLALNPDSLDPDLPPNPWSNVPPSADYLDYRFPKTSYVAVGADFWSLRAARMNVDWGAARENLYLSDSGGFLDQACGELALRDFSYSFLAASLDSIQEGGKSSQVPTPYTDIPRTLVAHRLQARFLDKIRLSLTEGAMIGGVAPDLRYLNPLTVFHSLFDFEHSSSYIGAELEVLPWKYASLYAGGVANQLESPYERQRYPGSAVIPDAYAWQAGSRAYLPLGPGWLELRAEYSYANPWMYIRENPAVSYSNEHYLCSNVPGSGQYDFPCLGFSQGPDSILSLFEASYRLPGLLIGSLGVQYLQKGQNELSTPYEQSLAAAALVSPSGMPENSLRLYLSGRYSPVPGLCLRLGGAYIQAQNASHVQGATAYDLQGIASLELEAFALGDYLKARFGK